MQKNTNLVANKCGGNVKTVSVKYGTKQVACNGTFADDQQNIDSKHPTIYIKLSKKNNLQLAVCPYCGTHFVESV